ncbi:MAG: DUF2334 domain-containing protein [Candidatus Bathyarchaeia archaeon]
MGSVSLNPWPFGYAAAFAIRDDDVSYFTPSYKIDGIYRRAWKKGFRVSLGVVPNLKTIDDPSVPPKYRGKMSEYAVHSNKELMDYLKEKIAEGKVDILQHGYNHDKMRGIPEFCIQDSTEIRSRLRLGRNILEGSLPIKIMVFVPPYDRVSKQAWGILKQEGLALCRKEGIRSLEKSTPLSFGNMISFTKIFTRNLNPLAKGFINFPGMIELHQSLNLWKKESFFERIEDAKRKFKDTLMTSGLFYIANHHWLYYEDWEDELSDRTMLDCFYGLLDFLDNYNLWKTTLTEVVNWIKKLDKVKVRVKGGKIILKSPMTIEGLTIKGENCTLTPSDEYEAEVKEEGDTVFLVYKKLEAGEKKIASVNL